MKMRRKLAAVACTAVIAALVPSAALAGENRGPPGTPNVPDSGSGIPTAGPAHANSVCVFSGLNDMVEGEGPIDTIVQTPGHFMLAGLTPPGVPGHGTGIAGFFENGCRGGTN